MSMAFYSSVISMRRLLSCCVVKRSSPTFIRYSPEKTWLLPFNEEPLPGIILISFTRYFLSASNPCRRPGNVLPAQRGWISTANTAAVDYKPGRSMVASVRRNEAIQITFKDDRFQTVVVLDCLITVKVLILIHVFQFDVES